MVKLFLFLTIGLSVFSARTSQASSGTKPWCQILAGPDKSETFVLVLDSHGGSVQTIKTSSSLDDLVKERAIELSGGTCVIPSSAVLANCAIVPGPDNSGTYGLAYGANVVSVSGDLAKLVNLEQAMEKADVCLKPTPKDLKSGAPCLVSAEPDKTENLGTIFSLKSGNLNLLRQSKNLDDVVALQKNAVAAGVCRMPVKTDLTNCEILPSDSGSGLYKFSLNKNLVSESADLNHLKQLQSQLIDAGACLGSAKSPGKPAAAKPNAKSAS